MGRNKRRRENHIQEGERGETKRKLYIRRNKRRKEDKIMYKSEKKVMEEKFEKEKRGERKRTRNLYMRKEKKVWGRKKIRKARIEQKERKREIEEE